MKEEIFKVGEWYFSHNGEQVLLMSILKEDERNVYVVKENFYEEDASYNERIFIAWNLFDTYQDVPMVARSTELTKNIENLQKEERDLQTRVKEAKMENQNIFAPEYKLGQKIYLVIFQSSFVERTIDRIKAIYSNDKPIEYGYYSNNSSYQLEPPFFLTGEDAKRKVEELQDLARKEQDRKDKQEYDRHIEEVKKYDEKQLKRMGE